MKQLIVALFAGSLMLSSMSSFAADAAKDQVDTSPAQGNTKTEKAVDYTKKKAHNAKVKTKNAGKKASKKTKEVIANRKTTDPASVDESRPDAASAKK